jgi:phosphopantothenoylcysteine decarboxylase/phosphopantothenate--cysteine ligase
MSVLIRGTQTMPTASLDILVTLGPTREPIDAVRYIGNRSSGRMGAAIVAAALDAGHRLTAICGPTSTPIDPRATVVRIETAQQMFDAVVAAFPTHDLLIMSAAVADFRPVAKVEGKVAREAGLTLSLEPTPDIVAHVSKAKRPDQRTVAFSLEKADAIERAVVKMRYKSVDLMVFNPLETMDAAGIRATLLWPDGRREAFDAMAKDAFAKTLVERATAI